MQNFFGKLLVTFIGLLFLTLPALSLSIENPLDGINNDLRTIETKYYSKLKDLYRQILNNKKCMQGHNGCQAFREFKYTIVKALAILDNLSEELRLNCFSYSDNDVCLNLYAKILNLEVKIRALAFELLKHLHKIKWQ